MTVGSFTSISLDPPLVGFFATTTSQSLSQILQAGQFAANVLADSQSAMSRDIRLSPRTVRRRVLAPVGKRMPHLTDAQCGYLLDDPG